MKSAAQQEASEEHITMVSSQSTDY